jgi:hypothetical protein
MAHGRFDEPPETMKIGNNGESVEACGPLRWNGDQHNDGGAAQSVTIQHVEIKQGSTRAEKDPNTQIQRGPDDWMVPDIPVIGPGKFEDGRAQAEADVEVVLESGQTRSEPWRGQVELGH